MEYKLIAGNRHTDERGTIRFANELDLTPVKRMYMIHLAKDVLRAWQGHDHENKWFYCLAGKVVVNLIGIKDHEVREVIELNVDEDKVLYISGGWATGFLAEDSGTMLQVFSNFTLEESKNDDIRFDKEHWEFKRKEMV